MQLNYSKYYLMAFLMLCVLSCNDKDGKSIFAPNRVDPPSIEDRATLDSKESLDRAEWQNPAFIVSQLGDIKGKTIADIGAGAGYFTFYLVNFNASVLAIDIDPDMLDIINNYKERIPEELRSNIETRLAKPDDPMLQSSEIDHAVIINTIGYIDNLTDYLGTLRPGIAKGGKIVIVDYKYGSVDVPEPTNDIIVDLLELEKDLEMAGYSDIVIDNTSLKYQYIVTAVAE